MSSMNCQNLRSRTLKCLPRVCLNQDKRSSFEILVLSQLMDFRSPQERICRNTTFRHFGQRRAPKSYCQNSFFNESGSVSPLFRSLSAAVLLVHIDELIRAKEYLEI